MAKAIFIFKTNIQPNMDELAYTDADGHLHGGFTLLESPDPERTYWIDASAQKIAAMKADVVNYEWIEDLPNDGT